MGIGHSTFLQLFSLLKNIHFKLDEFIELSTPLLALCDFFTYKILEADYGSYANNITIINILKETSSREKVKNIINNCETIFNVLL